VCIYCILEHRAAPRVEQIFFGGVSDQKLPLLRYRERYSIAYFALCTRKAASTSQVRARGIISQVYTTANFVDNLHEMANSSPS